MRFALQECWRQIVPRPVHACVEIFQQVTDIGGLTRIKIRRTGWRVGIALIFITIEQLQCNERVQEVARAAAVQPQSVRQLISALRAVGQNIEQPELDGAQQCLGFAEGERDVENVLQVHGFAVPNYSKASPIWRTKGRQTRS